MNATDQSLSRATDKRYYGVVLAMVVEIDDKDGHGRVRVKFGWFSESFVTCWCRVAQPYAGGGYGFYFIPEKDDQVVVGFVHGDMRKPIVLGGLYSKADVPHAARGIGDSEDPKYIRTKAGHMIFMEDGGGKEKIEVIDKSGKNKITIDTTSNTITITAKADVQIIADGDIALDAKKAVRINAGSTLDITASDAVTVSGSTIGLN